MLPLTEVSASHEEIVRTAGLGHRYPPGADAVACTRPQGGVGCKVWIDQGQSSGGLDDAGSLGPYSPESTSLQPFARAKLSQHRLCSLHPCSEPGRTSARRTLARLREGGMRSA